MEKTRTRTQRNPNNYYCVIHCGFTPISWPEFLKRFPKEANAFANESYLECWEEMGSDNPNDWTHLWDDEVFLNRDGEPIILGNITGPGGSLWLMYKEDEDDWDEVLLDDEGNLEFEDF
jgi:hypothetical protein